MDADVFFFAEVFLLGARFAAALFAGGRLEEEEDDESEDEAEREDWD